MENNISFNLDKQSSYLAFNINNNTQILNNQVDRSFEKILEKLSMERANEKNEDKRIDDKDNKYTSDKNNQYSNSSEIKELEKRHQIEKTDHLLHEIDQLGLNSNDLQKLIDILNKLIQKKPISKLEGNFLTENQNILQLINQKNTFLSNKDILPQTPNTPIIHAIEQLLNKNSNHKTLSDFLKNVKNILQEIVEITQKRNDRTGSIETLQDLIKTTAPKEVKLENIYVKPQDGFQVLQGHLERRQTFNNLSNQLTTDNGEIKSTITENIANRHHAPTKTNPTHHIGVDGNNTPVQKNLVVNLNFKSQFQNNHQEWTGNSIDGVSSQQLQHTTKMFKSNGNPQSINFKPFIEYLTGKIHNGFVNGKQVMLVKLQPENLGEVGILLKKENSNSLHLKMNVDNTEVKEILDKSLNEIKLGLEKQNLDLLSFEVDVNDGMGRFKQEHNDDSKKKFNHFLKNDQEEIFNEENKKTVDLRIRDNILNIKI